MTRSKSRGFTLIELLVVIAIIGLISSIVLASLSTARAKARDAARLSDMRQLQNALELYRTSNVAYPPTVANGDLSALDVLVTGKYIAKLPDDPQSDGTTPGWSAGSGVNHYYYWGGTPNNGINCGGPDAYYIFYHTETAYGSDPPGSCLSGTNRHARRMPR